MADFTGFYFDSHHSSAYGILRVSSGDRFNEDLSPDLENKTISITGRDGELYESQSFLKKEIKISIAYDSLTETQLHNLRKWLITSDLKELKLDERPYKSYFAKLASKPVLNYICFLDEEGIRRYKGEGELTFVAYNPYGYCNDNSTEITPTGLTTIETGINWQITDTYVPFTVQDENVNEWGEDAGLLSELELSSYNTFTSSSTLTGQYNNIAYIYNPGDIDADFELFISLDSSPTAGTTAYSSLDINIYIGEGNPMTDASSADYSFEFDVEGLYPEDNIILNTKNHSLKVISGENSSLRYDLVHSTDWPKIPTIDGYFRIATSISTLGAAIKYNYKYY